MSSVHLWVTSGWRSVAIAAVPALIAIMQTPNTASAQVTSTWTDISFTEFVPCADNGAGELVDLTASLHLVFDEDEGNLVIHGNQAGGSGVGLTTGNRYVGGGDPSNLNPAGDGDYLYHLSWIGVADGAKFSMTAKGQIGAPPTEVLEFRCQ